ncbi:MAG TPA: ribonuclease R, partial [Burkholderiales bacterium]|nr:ribonuclease R [Burkholderiales bacterium]
MSKKAKRTALRRRARTERIDSPLDDYSREILRELERAGEPLSVRELAQQLGIRAREQRAFKAGVAALERAGQVMQNRAGALLVARKIALVSGRVDGHPDGHGFLVPDEGGPSV